MILFSLNFRLTMKLKTFVAFHSFEAAYLAVLAILPFIAAIRIVATLLITFLVSYGVLSIIRKLMRQCISVSGQTVIITGCDTGEKELYKYKYHSKIIQFIWLVESKVEIHLTGSQWYSVCCTFKQRTMFIVDATYTFFT